jgi:DNA-binding IclR family transcriptional regulator
MSDVQTPAASANAVPFAIAMASRSSSKELEVGIRSVAVPIHGAGGSVVAAINVSSTTLSATLDDLRDTHLPALLETARSIDSALRQVDGP